MASVHPFIPFAERQGGEALTEPVEVRVPGMPTRATHDGATLENLADGGVVVDFGGGQGAFGSALDGDADDQDHGANLAEVVGEGALATIASDVIDAVDADLKSRGPWFSLIANALKRLGVEMSDEDAAKLKAFQIAKNVTFPLISEAVVQFQARAIAELFPPQGPAKTVVLGERTREREDQAERVADYLNYQMTIEDRAYFPQTDQMLFLLPIKGSMFRKVYYDTVLEMNVARVVDVEDFVVPYGASDLQTAPRFTHRQKVECNDMRKLQASGFYRDVSLSEPTERTSDQGERAVTAATDAAAGQQEPGGVDVAEDIPHQVEECYIDLDLEGFEDRDELDEATGIARPYVVHVERESQTVLAIYRNWKEDDHKKQKLIPFAHYKYLPGPGFYGWGLFHAIGGLDSACTGLLRTIITGAAFASSPGGIKTKDARVSGEIVLEPGVFKDSDSTYDELSKAFFTPQFKEPSEALFKVLGLLDELGKRYASTTEAMVGDAKNTGPVGTTVALIEQGSKVFSGIHKRNHWAAGEEFKLRSELNGIHLPDEGYPYDVPGAARQVYRQDFDERIDVLPVSDPNIFSSTQRIAIAQGVLELANNAPDLYDRREAHKRMLQAMRVPDVDALMPEQGTVPRCDPVTENALAMVGSPIRVYPDQNHDAHVAVHMGQIQLAQAQGLPNIETFMQIMLAHVGEHEAISMRLKFAQGMQVQMPPMNLHPDKDDGEQMVAPVPPDVENAIAVQAAQLMQQMVGELKQAQQQASAAPGQADAAQADQEHQAEEGRKDQAAQAEEKRKDMRTQAEVDRQDAKVGLDPATVKAAQAYLQQRGLESAITPRKLAVVSRALGKSFDDVVRMLMAYQGGGQGFGPAAMTNPAPGGVRMPR